MGDKFDFFNRSREPVILKDDNNSEKQLESLKSLLPKVNDEGKEVLSRDIKKLEYGIAGEKNILFELKNSHIPMFIIHDLFLSDGEQQAQIDYLVVTKKICFVIECKNLYGDIEINNKGDFIRKMQYGKYYKKEGIYSPITQNQRHMDLIKKIKGDKQTNILMKFGSNRWFENFYKSVVVLANPSTILHDRYAPKEIKNQVIRADQLISFSKEQNKVSKELASSYEDTKKWANRMLGWSEENHTDYTAKYEKYRIAEDETVSMDCCCQAKL